MCAAWLLIDMHARMNDGATNLIFLGHQFYEQGPKELRVCSYLVLSFILQSANGAALLWQKPSLIV